MNCKPGDLAVIIGGGLTGEDKKDIGMIVTVVEAYGDGLSWIIQSSGRPFGSGGYVVATFDTSLRPIRDPGDDVVDEFLALTGKPDYREKIAEKMKERV